MKILILLVASATAILAQTTVNIPALTISAEGTAAINATFAKIFVDGAQPISLTAPVAVGDTTISVVSTAGVAATSAIVIGAEAMKISAKTATAFNVTRAYYGTTAVAHAQTENANELKYPTLQRAFFAVIASFVGDQMDTAASSTISAQNAVISAAQAAKTAAKTAAVQ
jgi:hypothetical protein